MTTLKILKKKENTRIKLPSHDDQAYSICLKLHVYWLLIFSNTIYVSSTKEIETLCF